MGWSLRMWFLPSPCSSLLAVSVRSLARPLGLRDRCSSPFCHLQSDSIQQEGEAHSLRSSEPGDPFWNPQGMPDT